MSQQGKGGSASLTYLFHAPFGHVLGSKAWDLRQQFAVLLPAEMEAVGRVRGKGWHEDRLVEGLLQSKRCVWRGEKQDKLVPCWGGGVNLKKAGTLFLGWLCSKHPSPPPPTRKRGEEKKNPVLSAALRKRGPDANMGGVASFLLPGWRRLDNRIFGWELMAPFQLTGCSQLAKSTLHAS